jgi:hypothetical protein
MDLALKSSRILLEASPMHLNLDNITEDLLAVRNDIFQLRYHTLTTNSVK